MKYYSAPERKDILIRAATRTNLENMMLNEKSQAQKDKCRMIPLIWVS